LGGGGEWEGHQRLGGRLAGRRLRAGGEVQPSPFVKSQPQPKSHLKDELSGDQNQSRAPSTRPRRLPLCRQGDAGPLCAARSRPNPPSCSTKTLPSPPFLAFRQKGILPTHKPKQGPRAVDEAPPPTAVPPGRRRTTLRRAQSPPSPILLNEDFPSPPESQLSLSCLVV
jgi:hypothetical protein